jgi:6-phosphogluconolactonase (cycloisomerase 2 family)
MSGRQFQRRQFLGALGAAGATTILLPHIAGAAAEQPRLVSYLGSFTSTNPPGHGLDVAGCPRSGALQPVTSVGGVPDATFLAFSPDRRFLYSTNELAPEGTVTSLDITRPEAPTLLNARPTRGAGPTHLSVHPTGRFLLTANYTYGSVVVHRLETDGSIGESTDLVTHTGGRRDPLAHQVLTDPSGAWIVAVDLGADSVYTSRLDLVTGKLTSNQQVLLPPGTGPRHLAFHPDGRHAYVVAELNSTITTLSWDSRTGTFTPGQVLGTRSPDATGKNFPSEIAVSSDGRFVYAANRGDNTVSTFSVQEDGSRLAWVDTAPTGGSWPRHFALTPDETALYVANQQSGTVNRLSRNPNTGRLSLVPRPFPYPSVAVIAFHS